MSKIKSSFDAQVGGTWYSTLAIQPIEYITKNKLDWNEGNIVKYVTRHKLKHGAEDVRKVIHYAQMLLETNYGIKSKIEYDEQNKQKAATKSPSKRVHRLGRTPESYLSSVQGVIITDGITTADDLSSET